MEKFKACEKEMKTKAFSKEGLIQSAKLDPKAQEKLETTHWLQTQVEALQIMIEQAEAEAQSLQGSGKKKNRAGGVQAERLENLERLIERRKWHINRLELILRLLENGSISVERVNDLKEDVSYFLDNHTVCSTMNATLFWHDSRVQNIRMKTLKRMRASMMSSISTKRKRSLVSLMMMMMMTATVRRMQVKVRKSSWRYSMPVLIIYRFASSNTVEEAS